MPQKDTILQELEELGSTILTSSLLTPYQVRGDYFDKLATEVMSRIKAMEGLDSRQELANISSVLSTMPVINPYRVPGNYFADLEKQLLQAALKTEAQEYQSVDQELENISPLLGSLKKQTPYSVPDNYFEHLRAGKEKMQPAPAKVISFNSRKWIRYAAAAVVIGFVAIGGFLFFNKNEKIDPADKSYAWVKKNMNKVSTDELDKFIDLAEQEVPVIASNNPANEVKELIRNISDETIQDFLDDAQDAEPDSNDDILLN